MSLFAGIDCGTQSTKVVIVDTDAHNIIGQGQASHELITGSDGSREQEASWWTEALIKAFHDAVSAAKINPKEILGVGVSGQQHGFVPVNKNGQVISKVKLWCDTSTHKENAEIVSALGGEQACIDTLGIVPQTGYTVSKILHLKKHQPEVYKQLAYVMLPHDYLNFFLTGKKLTEFGDASGTGILNVNTKTYSKEVINAVDSSGQLEESLLPLLEAQKVIGTVQESAAKVLGLSTNAIVSTGGGDNMMAALGTGNVKDGTVTMSLGTSGTIFSCAKDISNLKSSSVAAFCSSSNAYLPLICTMNVTSTTSLVQDLLDTDLETFNKYLKDTPVGANGLTILPFFNGERVPALPDARGSIHNLDATNFTKENLCTASVEAATFGLRYGIDLLKNSGISATEIRLTGGGSKSKIWREIVANTMNAPVICVANSESAALGAAVQAMWAYKQNATQLDLEQLCKDFVLLDQETLYEPDSNLVAQYEESYIRYLHTLNQMYPKVNV